MAAIDFTRAKAFLAAIPTGRWTAFKDVAQAGGSPHGAQAIGDRLRREGDRVPYPHRVLRVDGMVPDAFHPAGPGMPANAESVRRLLEQEGVEIDSRGQASPHQRFTADDWPGRAH